MLLGIIYLMISIFIFHNKHIVIYNKKVKLEISQISNCIHNISIALDITITIIYYTI